jgi:hypothetical protein
MAYTLLAISWTLSSIKKLFITGFKKDFTKLHASLPYYEHLYRSLAHAIYRYFKKDKGEKLTIAVTHWKSYWTSFFISLLSILFYFTHPLAFFLEQIRNYEIYLRASLNYLQPKLMALINYIFSAHELSREVLNYFANIFAFICLLLFLIIMLRFIFNIFSLLNQTRILLNSAWNYAVVYTDAFPGRPANLEPKVPKVLPAPVHIISSSSSSSSSKSIIPTTTTPLSLTSKKKDEKDEEKEDKGKKPRIAPSVTLTELKEKLDKIQKRKENKKLKNKLKK